MLQKGTGERFKYKAEVLKVYPNAKCKRQTFQNLSLTAYIVSIHNKILSSHKPSAEAAWTDAWVKLPKSKNK